MKRRMIKLSATKNWIRIMIGFLYCSVFCVCFVLCVVCLCVVVLCFVLYFVFHQAKQSSVAHSIFFLCVFLFSVCH